MKRHAKAASVVVSLAMLLLAAAVPAALAAPTATTAWVYKTSFGSGELASVLSVPTNGLAIEADTGNILAPVELSQEVRVFAPDDSLGGTPFTQFSTSGHPVNIATDGETGAIYVNEQVFGTGSYRYLSDGAPTPTYTLDPDFAPEGNDGLGSMAVDPTTNEVVTFPGGSVRRLDPETGELISSFSITSLTYKFVIAVGLDGTIYISGEGEELLRYTPTGTSMPKFPLPGNVRSLAVDPTTGNILMTIGNRLLSLTPTGEKVFDVPMQEGSPTGIAIDPDRDRLYILNNASGYIDTYVLAPYAGVEAPSVSEITTTGLHVSTEVDPGEDEGGGVPDESTVHFEYRLVGEEGWTSTPNQEVNAAGSFAADITGLSPNLTYEVRAVASNSLTSHVTDPTKATTVAVAPAVETSPATDVTETGAVLNGTIDPIGLQTTYYFEYGTSTAYGSRVPAGIEAVAGGGREEKSFFRTITGLTPGTTYHFRLVATNSAGTTEGDDRSFTTIAVGGIPARAYEQVTSADKHGGAVVPRIGMQAAADGNGISYTTKAGSQASPLLTRSVALRGTSDWQGKIDTDPPLSAGPGGFLIHPTLAVSDDFQHTFVVSNLPQTPGGIVDGANLYKVDLATGAYHLIASSGATDAFNSFAGASTTGKYLAGAPDFSWLVFGSQVSLLPGAPTNAIYRWSEADGLEVVSTLPNGDMSSGIRGSVAAYETVSADGSRIYYTAFGGAEVGVFLRENGGAPTAISVSHVPGDPATPQPGLLLGVTPDGRYAFLSSAVKLTSDAPGEEGDLYRYDASDGSLEYLGVRGTFVNGIEVNFASFGIGADGGTLYFNAFAGPLSVWHDGAVHQVLSNSLLGGEEHVSPNGRYFASGQTVDGVAGVIELYDAESDELLCVSCLPDGTPVPGSLSEGGAGDVMISNRFPRVVHDDGTVYFDTRARMVAADVNGTRDVYVYRDGTVRLISPGNRPFDATLADTSESGNDVFFTTAQKLVGRDNDEAVDIYDARVGCGLPAQSPPPPQECLRDDCKETPGAGPELPFGGSEALSGPQNVKPKTQKKCGKGKRKVKVKGKVKCVKKHKAGKNKKGGNR